MNRYIPTLRPASFATLPTGVAWSYVEAPAQAGLAARPDLPTSTHPYGMIETSRPLTQEEVEHFDLRPVPVALVIHEETWVPDSIFGGGTVEVTVHGKRGLVTASRVDDRIVLLRALYGRSERRSPKVWILDACFHPETGELHVEASPPQRNRGRIKGIDHSTLRICPALA